MARAPLQLLAQVLRTTPEATKAQIGIHGNLVQNGQQTLEDLVSAQIQAIAALTPKSDQPWGFETQGFSSAIIQA